LIFSSQFIKQMTEQTNMEENHNKVKGI